jgi:hypothetical protein
VEESDSSGHFLQLVGKEAKLAVRWLLPVVEIRILEGVAVLKSEHMELQVALLACD